MMRRIGLAAGIVGLALVCWPGVALAAPETPVTEAPGSVTGTTATFNGQLNPGAGVETVAYRFAYSAGVGAECGESGVTAPKEAPFPEASGNQKKVSLAVTGLEGSTTYSVCLVAVNALEEATQGSQQVFTTPAAKPAIVAERVQEGSVTPYDGALEAEINPENFAGTYHFEYSTSNTLAGAKSFGESTFPKSAEAQGSGALDIGGGLAPSTTYYYRVVATNKTGTTNGPIQHFETATLQAPVISEPAASSVEHTTASIFALVNPEFQPTTGVFEYGLTESYGTELPFGPFGATTSGSPEGIGFGLEGLTPNTLYHWRAVAENGTGEAETPDETFVTLPNPPTASSQPATAIGASTATINGLVNPENTGQPGQDATTYLFQFGRTASYGAQTPLTPGEAGEGTTAIPEHATLEHLQPGATYHYRIIATNNSTGTAQTVYGEDETFTTTSTPPVLANITPTAGETTATVTAILETENLATRYQLSLATGPSTLQPVASGNTSTPGTITMSAAGLASGTTYYYAVTAQSSNGTSEATGQFTTAPAPPPPAQPGLPTVIPAQTIQELDAREAIELKSIHTQPVLTRTQLLAKALKKCHKDHRKQKRTVCEKQAHRRYGTSSKHKKH
jgi:hypothetical protein